jgi:uncharacterized RDD family membrane protein YckC
MSMPQGGESGQPWDTAQHRDEPGQQWQSGMSSQAGMPGQEGVPGQRGMPGQGTVPGQGAVPAQGGPGQASGGAFPAQPVTSDHRGQPPYDYPSETVTAPMQGRPISPVNEIETRVTGSRVVQYIIDYIITGVVASFIMWVFNRSTGAANAVLLLIGAVIAAAWYFWYWVYRPYQKNGQSIGMQILGLRVISKDGRRASMMQLFIRGILLIVDTLVWGLVGLITILLSRYRQRVGDHAAKTLVVRARMQPMPGPREYADAGRAGFR